MISRWYCLLWQERYSKNNLFFQPFGAVFYVDLYLMLGYNIIKFSKGVVVWLNAHAAESVDYSSI